jgi:hypothetical protein
MTFNLTCVKMQDNLKDLGLTFGDADSYDEETGIRKIDPVITFATIEELAEFAGKHRIVMFKEHGEITIQIYNGWR